MATATALHPGKLSETVSFRSRYGNYIGGKVGRARIRPVL